MSVLNVTPLHALHQYSSARMVPFAGYDMPLHYQKGILAEHLHTRSKAGLFDVSHMGQAWLEGTDYETVAGAMERLCAADVLQLAPGRQRYSQLLNDQGGIIDDFMMSRPQEGGGRLHLVVNAARKAVDYAFLSARLPASVTLTPREDRALLALQGPKSAAALALVVPGLESLPFMHVVTRGALEISRSGYCGEDGFEISLPAHLAEAFVRQMLENPQVALVGLGARDTLRLEAGLCLYGHELNEEIDPITAGLGWSIGKRRRLEGGFLGAERIQAALREGTKTARVGLRLEGRAPAREGAEIVTPEGRAVGRVTSGGFGPMLQAAIAMGYVDRAFAAPGTALSLVVRGKPLAAHVVALPFHPHTYSKGEV